MTVRIAINGFGRVGRLVLRATVGRDIEVVGINDLSEAGTIAHLLKWDSVHGRFPGDVEAEEDGIVVDGRRIAVHSERDPAALPWGATGVDVVIEATGAFRDRLGASKHLEAGAGRVLITAPAKDPDVTVVLGVNDEAYDPAAHRIVSNASCTTNCLAPVAMVIHEGWGIARGFMTTVHAYTNDQPVLDWPHDDPRRARAAALSMIPTTTGAAQALGLVLPDLAGRLGGMAIRVPVPNVSLVDLSVELERDADASSLNEALGEAAEGRLQGILQVCDEPLVSVDFYGNPHSSIVDSLSTAVVGKRFAKILSWYDNEWGYSCRIVDLALRMGPS